MFESLLPQLPLLRMYVPELTEVMLSFDELSHAQRARLKARLEGMTGKQIIISYTLDPSLLGGMKLRYMGLQLDGTVKSKLDSFARSLSELVI